MKLKFLVDDLEGIDEKFHELYEKGADGKYRLQAEGLDDVTGLKSALERQKKEINDLKAKIEAADAGTAEHKKLKKQLEKLEQQRAEKEGDWESLKAQLLSSHKEEMDAKDREIAALNGQLESTLVDSEVTKAIIDQKGNPRLLTPHVKASVKMVDENGKKVARVIGADGRPKVDAAGNPIAITAFVEGLKKETDFQVAFQGTDANGGGALPDGGKPPIGGKSVHDMNSDERAAYVEKVGQAQYLKELRTPKAAA